MFEEIWLMVESTSLGAFEGDLTTMLPALVASK
jgi:hypothetical protein